MTASTTPAAVPWGPYSGRVLSVHDGDTLTVQLDIARDIGFGMVMTATLTYPMRLWQINAPELPTPEGIAARDYLRGLIPAGSIVTVLSHNWDKYAPRVDASVSLPAGVGDLSDAMVAAGHAVRKVYR